MFDKTEEKNRFDSGKLKRTHEKEKWTSDEPSSTQNWKEAAATSLILAIAQVFIAFLTLYDLTSIATDPASFAFDLFKFAGASFFGAFIALTGLAKYKDK